MTKARQAVTLGVIGIQELRPRRAVMGGLILKVARQGNAAKAEILTGMPVKGFAGTGVQVARTVKLTDMRVTGLDDSVTRTNIIAAATTAGGCAEGEIKWSQIRRAPSDFRTA